MKSILVSLLLPLAYALQSLQGARRLWAFCQLQAAIAARLDRSVVLMGCPQLDGTRNITFGRHLLLYRDLHLETQQQGQIYIGDQVVISRGVHIVAFDRIEIGAGSMIGEYASLRDANHSYGGGLPLRQSGHRARPIKIGRNVWIGRGVAVLPGVTIGDDAVVGANAVVTRDVAAGVVVAGIPARLLSQGVTT